MHNANDPDHTSRTAPDEVLTERTPASPDDAPGEQPRKEVVAPTAASPAKRCRDRRRRVKAAEASASAAPAVAAERLTPAAT